ncbi:MAG: hypothetical protein WD991_02430 [Candidatus Paceibacterota bacterium]
MDLNDLNKSQLILLAILLSFVTSIATGITTVTLMQQAPASITVPINRVIRETVQQMAPESSQASVQASLSTEDKKLLEELKAIKPLTVSLFSRGEKTDKILGTGLFLGDNKVVIASPVPAPKDGEIYVVKSVLGEQKVLKLIPEKDFTIIELIKTEIPSKPPVEEKEAPAPVTP